MTEPLKISNLDPVEQMAAVDALYRKICPKTWASDGRNFAQRVAWLRENGYMKKKTKPATKAEKEKLDA